jgi:hypothetical protein
MISLRADTGQFHFQHRLDVHTHYPRNGDPGEQILYDELTCLGGYVERKPTTISITDLTVDDEPVLVRVSQLGVHYFGNVS